jgi:hypothetical protein
MHKNTSFFNFFSDDVFKNILKDQKSNSVFVPFNNIIVRNQSFFNSAKAYFFDLSSTKVLPNNKNFRFINNNLAGDLVSLRKTIITKFFFLKSQKLFAFLNSPENLYKKGFYNAELLSLSSNFTKGSDFIIDIKDNIFIYNNKSEEIIKNFFTDKLNEQNVNDFIENKTNNFSFFSNILKKQQFDSNFFINNLFIANFVKYNFTSLFRKENVDNQFVFFNALSFLSKTRKNTLILNSNRENKFFFFKGEKTLLGFKNDFTSFFKHYIHFFLYLRCLFLESFFFFF